jgi:hypothetical protein
MATPMGHYGIRMGVLGGRVAAAGLHAHPRCRALPQQFLIQPQRGMVEPAWAIV